MTRPVVVVVNGPPGAGKTSLGRRLALRSGLPFLSKDDFKHVLFDTLGAGDREWSAKVGVASVRMMFEVARTVLDAGGGVVLENAFVPRHDRARMRELIAGRSCGLLEVWCWAPVDVLYERFHARALSRERHPGHVDQELTREGFEDLLRDRAYAPLDLGGHLLKIETSEDAAPDFEVVFAALEAAEVYESE